MTQKVRWLAALALLLAFGACAVRAEDEEDQAPLPKPTVVEILPAPYPAPVEVPLFSLVSQSGWMFQFPAPYPFPTPPPASPFAGCGQECRTCPACVACPSRQAALPEPPQYVLEMKMIQRGAHGDNKVVSCPRLSVMEGQPASMQTVSVDAVKGRGTLQTQATMTKQGDGALLSLVVTEARTHDAPSGSRTQTETAESQCSVQFGKPCKVLLKQDADGMECAWMEVTVHELNQPAPVQQTANVQLVPASTVASPQDADDSPLECVADAVGSLLQTIADAASELFSPETAAAPVQPAQYVENPLPPPLPRSVTCREGTCPASTVACIPCSVVEAVQKPVMHLAIDATHDRKCIEMSDGKKRFKASADRLTVHDDCIQLEGDVRGESCDDSCHDCMTIKADKIVVERKDEGLKIHIND